MTRFIYFSLLVGIALSMNADDVKDEYHAAVDNEDDFSHLSSNLQNEEKSWEEESVSDHSEHNIFDLLQEHVFGPLLAGLSEDRMWDYVLVENNGSYALTSQMSEIIGYFARDSSICGGNCSSDGAHIFGCNCRNAFYALDGPACQAFLCNIFGYAEDNLLDFFLSIKGADSVQDIVKAGVTFMKPYASDLCTCKNEMFGAVKKCLTKYDGHLVEEEDLKDFRGFFKDMELKKMEKVLISLSSAYCNASCNHQFDEMLIEFVGMFDNSLNGGSNDTCSHFRHISDTIWQIAEDIGSFNHEDGEDAYINFILQQITKIPKAFWCGRAECVDDYNSMFNNCCYRNAVDSAATKSNVKKVVNFLDSIPGFDMPEIYTKTQRRLAKSADPALMCKKLDYDDQCNA